MPKACISCQNYSHAGYDEDAHCPFEARSHWDDPPTRTQWGHCSLHATEVFATQICTSHDPEPFVTLVDVTNRPEPRVPLQERML